MAAQRFVTYIAKPFRQKSAIVQKLARISSAISDSDLLYKILLSFTDQQLITGLAILIAGYVQTNTITQYHFAIVQNMATLSFTIHDTTAVILEDNILQNPVMRTWRGVAIICFQFMTLVTYLPLGHEYWMANYGMPTVCLWQHMPGHYYPGSWQSWNMVVYMMLLIRGIMCTLYAYFPSAWGWVDDNRFVNTAKSGIIHLTLSPRRAYNASISQSNDSLTHKCLSWFWWSLSAYIFVITEILSSQAFELQRCWTVIINNIYYTFELRSSAVEKGREGDEDAWGFGQAVPMFLLILPLALIWETGYGRFSRSLSHHARLLTVPSDAYKERSRQVTRYNHPQHHINPSSFPERSADMRVASDAAYAVIWEGRTQSEPTCWISSVEVTSHSTSHASSRSSSHPSITQRFSPASATGVYARVLLDNTGKRARFSGAGYYFGQDEAINKWDLEDSLYRSSVFRTFMLGLLLASFAGMTILGITL